MRNLLRILLLAIFTYSCLPAYPQSTTIVAGKPAPFIKLKNINDSIVSFNDYPSARGFIIIFICNTCPYSKAYEQRIIALDKKYSLQHFPVLAVNPNDPELSAGDSFIKMKEHSKLRGYTFPYLYDERQVITNLYGARSTPQVFVISKNDSNYTVEYTGAIDNDIQNSNPDRINYVQDAVSALLNNKRPAVIFTRAIGCSISRRKN
ncbi:MAG: thioredoxin family protein [Ferruginibacter sp.]